MYFMCIVSNQLEFTNTNYQECFSDFFYWGINCISIISLHICDFSSKSNGSIYIPLRLYCYIYCKFKGLYEHQQETKIPFLAIFDNFSRKLSEINLN